MFTKFTSGKKSLAVSGTEQVRTTVVPPENDPARNHTEPRWPTMQFAPLISAIGLTVVGIDIAHCHHCAVSSLKDSVSEDAVCAYAAHNDMISPRPTPTLVQKPLSAYFIACSPKARSRSTGPACAVLHSIYAEISPRTWVAAVARDR